MTTKKANNTKVANTNATAAENKTVDKMVGANKETVKGTDGGSATTTTVVAATPKTQIANAVFAEMFGLPEDQRPARKDMIAAAMEKAGISKDCAATYLQNYKRKNGLQKTSQPAA